MYERERKRYDRARKRSKKSLEGREALTRPRVKDSANSIKSFLNMLSKLR